MRTMILVTALMVGCDTDGGDGHPPEKPPWDLSPDPDWYCGKQLGFGDAYNLDRCQYGEEYESPFTGQMVTYQCGTVVWTHPTTKQPGCEWREWQTPPTQGFPQPGPDHPIACGWVYCLK
jgi:hypothetical protein